ncbi:uncharacterized protein B4U80_07940 [Leptotrombidium deliense]|uniref:Death domain-containing protein n=1 Tax=Leptotrombidium deliense TaxID=299467 RepID=A0A443SC26_9ACAR|nr:uncharacterized protein B4U80_07940 [Leptotrombidium deliense]
MPRNNRNSHLLKEIIEEEVSDVINEHLKSTVETSEQVQQLPTSDYGSTCSRLSLESLTLDDFNEAVPNANDDERASCLRQTRNRRILHYQGITAVIPCQNLSNYKGDEYYIDIIEDCKYSPSDSNWQQISKVVCIGPHGTRFDSNCPALIKIAITKKHFQPSSEIICLYSDTQIAQLPKWEKLKPNNFTVKGKYVVIKAFHFSLFTVVLETQFPFVSQTIHWFGSTLSVPNVPGVELKFPPLVVDNIDAFCKVLFDKEPFQYHGGPNNKALASPIIMVGPEGMIFRENPVTISLPIPCYWETVRTYGKEQAVISVWRSAKNVDGSLIWVEVTSEIEIHTNHPSGEVVISFPVYHFSFFKAVWDVLSDSMYGMKLGLSYFYPFMSFSMMCQASMEENKDNRSFALEVILYRSDKEKPEMSNYPYKVGRSLKPKLVRMGSIVIKLKSELFEANVEAGEDDDLTKIEDDFRGREFEKQFVCRYKEGKEIVNKGTIGKVVVERVINPTKNELLFEFNLHKHGCESEDTRTESVNEWSLAAFRELAETLRITQDNNWKKLAHQIGFTKSEIESKLSRSVDPFLEVVNLYQKRGGTPEEFLQRLHEVSRKVNGMDPLDLTPPRSRRGTPSSLKSDGSASSRRLSTFETPTKWRDDESDIPSADTETTNISSISSRKRFSDRKESVPRKRRKKVVPRRRQFSEYSETVSSSENSSADESATERLSMRKLSDSDMWQISSLMNTMNWRALGRTLGLEESVLLNIEHAYKSTGFRECAYQMMLEWKGRRPQQCTYGNLYTALCKEKMNAIAKGISKLALGQESNGDDIE